MDSGASSLVLDGGSPDDRTRPIAVEVPSNPIHVDLLRKARVTMKEI